MSQTCRRVDRSTSTSCKLGLVDAVHCALGALAADTIKRLGAHPGDFGSGCQCTSMAVGPTALDRVASFNGAPGPLGRLERRVAGVVAYND
jgi:hypothetical protein